MQCSAGWLRNGPRSTAINSGRLRKRLCLQVRWTIFHHRCSGLCSPQRNALHRLWPLMVHRAVEPARFLRQVAALVGDADQQGLVSSTLDLDRGRVWHRVPAMCRVSCRAGLGRWRSLRTRIVLRCCSDGAAQRRGAWRHMRTTMRIRAYCMLIGPPRVAGQRLAAVHLKRLQGRVDRQQHDLATWLEVLAGRQAHDRPCDEQCGVDAFFTCTQQRNWLQRTVPSSAPRVAHCARSRSAQACPRTPRVARARAPFARGCLLPLKRWTTYK